MIGDQFPNTFQKRFKVHLKLNNAIILFFFILIIFTVVETLFLKKGEKKSSVEAMTLQ